MAAKKVRMSAEGLKNLEKELEYLITERRVEVAQKLKEARGFGDLSENAEYDEAKNEQGILEAHIKELEQTIANAVVVDESELTNDEVGVGSVVEVEDLELEETMTLQIVQQKLTLKTTRSPKIHLSVSLSRRKRSEIFLKLKHLSASSE